MNSLAENRQTRVNENSFSEKWEQLFWKTQTFQPAGDNRISFGGGIYLEYSEDIGDHGGINTKFRVKIRNESDKQTLVGKVCFIEKCGYGLHNFVNDGTEEKPLYKLYPRSIFGADTTKWLKNEGFI